MRRRADLGTALALTALLTGACTVTSPSDPGRDRPSLEQFRAQNGVSYDLSTPPSADELGLTGGRDSAIFDRDGSQYWDVDVRLPEGASFSTGRTIAVTVFLSFVPGGLLNAVGINVRAENQAQLSELLRRDVDQLGLDPAQVERYLASPNRLDNQVLDGRDFGYLSTSVELRPQSDRPGVVALNYSFTWEPTTTPAA